MKAIIFSLVLFATVHISCADTGYFIVGQTVYEGDSVVQEQAELIYVGTRKEVTEFMIKNGEVCNLLGHIWENDMILSGFMYADGTLVNGEEKRHCKVCGKVQIKKVVTNWIDAE